jgi:hypothetical protein
VRVKWQLPAGVALLLLLLVLLVPTVNEVAFSLQRLSEARTQGTGPPPPGAAPSEPPVPPILIDTLTNITESPEQARKGQAVEARGTVLRAEDERPAAGVKVDVYLNITKESPGIKVAEATTGPDGVWVAPLDLQGILPHDYQLVAGARITPINATHGWNVSWSDPPLRITSPTNLALEAPERAPMGAAVPVKAVLTDGLGEPVRGEQVEVVLPDGRVVRGRTDVQGAFVANATFASPGQHAVEARFAGSDHLEAARANATIEALDLVLEVPARVEVVRGEALRLPGRVVAGGNPLPDAEVLLALDFIALLHDDHRDGSADLVHPHTLRSRTGPDGQFLLEAPVAASSPPGAWPAFAGLSGGVGTPLEVVVQARTALALDAPRDLTAQSAPKVRLTDDLGVPLLGRVVHLAAVRPDGRTIAQGQGATDAQGMAAIPLDLRGAAGQQVVLRATFQGEPGYLPSEARADATVAWALPLEALAVLLLLLAGGGAYAWHRRRLALLVPPGPGLHLEFPDIAPDLPLVWAPGVPLAVRVAHRDLAGQPLAGAPVELRLGQARYEVRTDAHGMVEVEAVLPIEGAHDLAASVPARLGMPPAHAAATLRAVDYRAEVGREYTAFRDHLHARGLDVDRHTAPLELEAVLAAQGPLPEDLDPMLRALEVASWSGRPFHRADYVRYVRHQAKVRAALDAPPPRAGQAPHPRGEEGEHAAA